MLKRTEVGACRKGREWPGYRDQDDNERDGVENGHRFEFGGIALLAFDYRRADGDDNNGDRHERDVDQAKKYEVELFNRFFKMRPEVADKRAVEIKHISDHQLNVRQRRRYMSYRIVGFGERPLLGPAAESAV